MKKKVETGPKISEFGSHNVMIASAMHNQFGEVYPEFLGGKVLCQDEHGEYVTEVRRLDDGMADPNRYDRGIEQGE